MRQLTLLTDDRETGRLLTHAIFWIVGCWITKWFIRYVFNAYETVTRNCYTTPVGAIKRTDSECDRDPFLTAPAPNTNHVFLENKPFSAPAIRSVGALTKHR